MNVCSSTCRGGGGESDERGFGSDFGWIDVDLIIDIDVSTRSFAHAEEEEKPEKDGDD